MKGRMFDVVVYLARRYGVGRFEDDGDLRQELMDAGFEEDDVERGLSWLRALERDRLPVRSWGEIAGPTNRSATPEEALRVSPAARGFLLRLERGGILDSSMREAVYERALGLDVPEVGLEEARVLAALVLKASPAADDDLVTRVLEGDLESVYH